MLAVGNMMQRAICTNENIRDAVVKGRAGGQGADGADAVFLPAGQQQQIEVRGETKNNRTRMHVHAHTVVEEHNIRRMLCKLNGNICDPTRTRT